MLLKSQRPKDTEIIKVGLTESPELFKSGEFSPAGQRKGSEKNPKHDGDVT